jgi:RES domain-containing protein
MTHRRSDAVSASVERPADTLGVAGPITTSALCSGPPTDRLDITDLVTTDGNRWSGPGEPTLYLAGDVGVALAEVGRHWDATEDREAIWRVRLALTSAVDLRREDVRAAVGVPEDPRWFLDRGRCRALAARFRTAGCDGMIVPSVAFLDDLDRWNAVVFVDRAAPLERVVLDARRSATITAAG